MFKWGRSLESDSSKAAPELFSHRAAFLVSTPKTKNNQVGRARR